MTHNTDHSNTFPTPQTATDVDAQATTDLAGQTPAVSTDNAAPTANEAPIPFIKRKWVLITAPIVAGVLLLGIGAGAGYALSGDSGHGGGHDRYSQAEPSDGMHGGGGHGHGGGGGRDRGPLDRNSEGGMTPDQRSPESGENKDTRSTTPDDSVNTPGETAQDPESRDSDNTSVTS